MFAGLIWRDFSNRKVVLVKSTNSVYFWGHVYFLHLLMDVMTKHAAGKCCLGANGLLQAPPGDLIYRDQLGRA